MNTLAISCCTMLLVIVCGGCKSNSTGERVIQSQKGYYPMGCKVCSPDGREDEYPDRTYVLSVEAYRAILMGE
jgi:hypothetical protein